MTITRKTLPEDCYRMAIMGGYVLAFATRVGAALPEMSWDDFRIILESNGHAYCGYAPEVVRRAFERGKGQ